MDTCSYVSLGWPLDKSRSFYVNVDLGSEVDALARTVRPGNLDTVRVPRCWQLVLGVWGRMSCRGLLGNDFRDMFAYSVFLAWFDSGCMYMRQSRWSPDHISTSPVYPATHCSVSASLEEQKKRWIYLEMSSATCFHAARLSS